jgi:CO/xanthine dehydrogenase FAD-binding subunit
MTYLRPQLWTDALAQRASHRSAVVVAGGTDLMPVINLTLHRPPIILDLSRVTEIASHEERDGYLWIGATTTCTEIAGRLATRVPALAQAARALGSPQIRNRATLGGNLGSASPAGDSHPSLLALRASIELESLRGLRILPVADFFTGVKRHALDPDELIRGVRVPMPCGPQVFAKVGVRNAMVIATCSFALVLYPASGSVGTGIGAAAPTPIPAAEAESMLATALGEGGYWANPRPLPDDLVARFAELTAQATRPIDDLRGTARYRRHAIGVIAARALHWCWRQYQDSAL